MPIRLTKSVKIISILIFVFFLIQKTSDLYLGTQIYSLLSLESQAFFHRHYYWQILTYPFLSGDVSQLFFNLLMFVFVGSDLESFWGSRSFLRYLFFCSISLGLIYVLSGMGRGVPLVGPSGVLYGLFAAYGLIFGERVLLFMLLFPIQAKYFALILAAIQLLTALFSPGVSAVTSFAHFLGMGVGAFYLWGLAKWQISRRNSSRSFISQLKKLTKKRRSSRKHLKLVVNRLDEIDQADQDSDESPKTWH